MLGDICSPLVGKAEELKAFLKEYYSDPNYANKDLVAELQKRFVVGERDAKKFVELLVGEVSTRTSEAKKNAPSLKQLFRNAPPGRKPILDKLLQMSNAGAFKTDQYLQAAAKKLGVPVLTEDAAKELERRATALQKLDGDARDVAAAQLLQTISNMSKRPIGEKLRVLDTASMLLDTTTTLTNIVGNTLYGEVMQGLSNPVATAIDAAVSLFTKQRTIVFRNPLERAKGYAEGFSKGFRDARLGIDTSNIANRHELPQGNTFTGNSVLDRAGRALETVLGVTLKATDRAFATATYRESIANQKAALKASGKELTPELEAKIEQQANVEALVSTFQDRNRISDASRGLKESFNTLFDLKGFGLGELIYKFPVTPANILARSLDFTPLGAVDAVGKAVKGIKEGDFNQRQFSQKMADSIVGFGIAAGIAVPLAEVGILTSPSKVGSKESANDSALGKYDYQINVSALQRFVSNGFDPKAAKQKDGDTLYSYSKYMPFSFPFIAGTMIAKYKNTSKEQTAYDIASAGILGTVAASDSMTNQNMLRNIDTLLNSYDSEGNKSLGQGFLNVLLDTPQRAVPSMVAKGNYLFDNTEKETRDASPVQTRINKFVARVPFARNQLPDRYDVAGNKSWRYLSNDPVSIFVNPSFVKQIKADPALREVNRLYEATGDTSVLLRNVSAKLDIQRDGKKIPLKLNAQQISDYQKMLGTVSAKWATRMAGITMYQDLDTESQAKVFASVLSASNDATKRALFKHQPKTPSKLSDALLEQDDSMAELYIMQKVLRAYKKQLGGEALEESDLDEE